MGFIYKVTNKINGHLYIGQTRQTINARWSNHCSAATDENNKDYNCPLHLAIAKYGKDNFIVEQIEECDNSLLNEREIYWINYYNSYNNGYNASIGGAGHTKYNYDDIVNYYLSNNFSISKTCQHFSIYDQVVYTALHSKHIDYTALKSIKKPNRYNKKILLVEKNIIFNSMAEIDVYFGKVVHPNIRRCLNGITKRAYGYTWKEVDNE